MQRSQLTEFHYITPIANVPSILKHGILSHNQAARLQHDHDSIAMQEVKDKRAEKKLDGRPLFDYVNIYFTARNPMMFVRRDRHNKICVLRVSPDIIDLAGAVISDHNAASKYAKFFVAPGGLGTINYDRVFAEFWTHPDDPFEERDHKSVKCSEVLMPDRIGLEHIVGAYVSGLVGQAALRAVAPDLDICVDGNLFFQ
jgi:ssDNA thymidine ADP-ribosyltransferase DarT-like protein